MRFRTKNNQTARITSDFKMGVIKPAIFSCTALQCHIKIMKHVYDKLAIQIVLRKSNLNLSCTLRKMSEDVETCFKKSRIRRS